MKCKDCKKNIKCKHHGEEDITEFQHEDDKSYYYSCGKCVDNGGAFGSIVHWCKDMFGVFT